MPVMVCMDGFILTHAYERVDIPEQAEVDAFLPPYEPRQVLDPSEPVSIGAMVGPEAFMEVRYLAHAKQLAAEMDCPITRLYYHLKLLQSHGLIFVERTRKVSGIFEKYYRASARAFVIDRNTDGQEDPARSQALLAFVFDQTRLDISNGLRSGRIDSGKLPPEVGALMAYRTVMKLSPAPTSPALRSSRSDWRMLSAWLPTTFTGSLNLTLNVSSLPVP